MFSLGFRILSQGQQGQQDILSDSGLYSSISGSMPSLVHNLDLWPRSLGIMAMLFGEKKVFWVILDHPEGESGDNQSREPAVRAGFSLTSYSS